MWLYSCAKTGTLSGGPVDQIPPKFVVEKSSANYQTNFSDKKIVLVFDEFVELKQLDKNLLISPPMLLAPEVVQRGKTVTIKIPKDEVLRADATYSIDLGSAIVDYNAGNALEGFKYVFATGDKIDSLSLSGTIKDAYTDEPVADAYLMLYDILTDSIVAQERPFYIVKTDESGAYKLENLRSDTFKIIALQDLNFNYMYDLPAEAIGFIDSTIVLHDSSATKYDLTVSKTEMPVQLVSNEYRTYGLLLHRLTAAADTTDIAILYPNDLTYYEDRYTDTLNIWYTGTPDSIGLIVAGDTLTARVPTLDSIFLQKALAGYITQPKIAPWDTAIWKADAPIASLDTALIQVFEKPSPRVPEQDSLTGFSSLADSSGVARRNPDRRPREPYKKGKPASLDTMPPVVTDDLPVPTDILVIDSSAALGDTLIALDTTYIATEIMYKLRSVMITASWAEDTEYEVLLLPGAVTDIYGRTNDTVTYQWEVATTDEYGDIKLAVTATDTMQQYLIQLYEGDKLVKQNKINSTPVDTIKFTRLPMAQYSALIIEDRDGNGRWSAGDYWQGSQPEPLRRYQLQAMQPTFDTEATLSWMPEVVPPADSTAQSVLDSLGGSPLDTLNGRPPLPDKAGKRPAGLQRGKR